MDAGNEGGVRNLGKPVELAGRYFREGADEVSFLGDAKSSLGDTLRARWVTR